MVRAVLGLLLAFAVWLSATTATARDGGADAGQDLSRLLQKLSAPDEGERRGAAVELSRIGSTEAVRAIARAAPDQAPALRREMSDMLTALGDRAIAGLLIEWRTSPVPNVKRFAGAQLEAMEKRMPGEAIQTQNPEILAEVLRAYGIAKDLDALGVVLSFTNADKDLAREAARQAIYDYGAVAAGKLKDAYAAFHNRPAPDEWAPDRVASELFASYDRDRRKEMYVLLDQGLDLLKRARATTPPDAVALKTAVDVFDRILARAPAVERRAEMVPAYVLLAQAIEGAEPDRAMMLYRKAAHLDPASPRSAQIDGAILALEAKALRERGVIDEELLKRAVALDPANAIAQSELALIERSRGERRDRIVDFMWMGGAVAVIGVVLLGVLELVRRLRAT